MPNLRLCEECSIKMAPGAPRREVDGRLLCAGCAGGGRTASLEDCGACGLPMRQAGLVRRGSLLVHADGCGHRRLAHDSGDGQRIFHCPFCGGGQVTARSDGSTECGFCLQAFTIQVQPMHPSMPQTINGQPVTDPSMPEEGSRAVPEQDGEPETSEQDEVVAPKGPIGQGSAKGPIGQGAAKGPIGGAPAPKGPIGSAAPAAPVKGPIGQTRK